MCQRGFGFIAAFRTRDEATAENARAHFAAQRVNALVAIEDAGLTGCDPGFALRKIDMHAIRIGEQARFGRRA